MPFGLGPLKNNDIFYPYRIFAGCAGTQVLTLWGLSGFVGGLVPADRRRAPHPPPLQFFNFQRSRARRAAVGQKKDVAR